MGGQQQKDQKVDHGGQFFMVPRQVMRSAAYVDLSRRARVTLFELMLSFTGFNNGKIGMTIDHLGARLGNQNHSANSRAIAELIEHGFVECTSDADHVRCKAREYRITFIHTDKAKATHEWRGWKPSAKIGPEPTATRKRKPVEATATRRKLPVEATATPPTETRRVGGRFHVEATTAHIGNHSYLPDEVEVGDGESYLSPDDMRVIVNGLITDGEATAAEIAKAINLPTGTMSKYRGGRNLPEAYRGPLHIELAGRGVFGAVRTVAKSKRPPWLFETGYIPFSLANMETALGADACWMPVQRVAA